MKKYILLILILLTSFKFYSQIKNEEGFKEVVFLLYDDINNNNRVIKKLKEDSEKNHYLYSYYFGKYNKISFLYKEFLDFDEKFKDNSMLFFKVNKSFLRKNKDIILTKEKMSKYGYVETLLFLKKAKRILLIDINQKSKKNVIIKEVILYNSDPKE